MGFSGVIVILAYKSTVTFRFTLWLLSVMNNSIKDYYKPLLNLVESLLVEIYHTRNCNTGFTIHQKS